MVRPPVDVRIARPAQLSAGAAAALDTRAQTPFQTPAYAAALEAAGGDALVVEVHDDDRPVGHGVLLERRVLGHATWLGLSEPALAGPSDAPAFWRGLVEAGRARGVLSASWREAATVRLSDADVAAAEAACTAVGAEAARGELTTHVVDLSHDEDALWARLDRRHRNAVRGARSAGVRVERSGADAFVQAYMPLSEATFARSGVSGPHRAYFSRLLADAAGDSTDVRCYLARDDAGAPVAGALVTLRRKRAVYLHGASARQAHAPGASALLQWHAMLDLRSAGALSYDLGGCVMPGSPQDVGKAAGIRRFKERLGGALEFWPSLHLQLDAAAYARAAEEVRAARASSAAQAAG